MDSQSYAARYMGYLESSPTSFDAATNGAALLTQAGFKAVDETATWPITPGNYFLQREGALIAWVIPLNVDAITGFSIFGCHTDSPALKLKPTPQSSTPDGWGQLSIEVYGGPLFNSWLDRELLLAGVVYDLDGNAFPVRTEPLARIPQLAIHLDRGVNNGLTLDPQQHLQPVWTVDNSSGQIMDLVAQSAGLNSAAQIAGHDLFLVPAQSPATFGDEQQFIAAGRQDNLSSVYAGLEAIIAAAESPNPERIAVLAAFDHEEVGSESRTGAAGPLLEDVLRRTAGALGFSSAKADQLVAGSDCISADAGHSVHPNYPTVHDPQTRPMLGRGPLTKINANQRYASEGRGIALWERVCAAAGFTPQAFVSNNAIPCGSTIGPITATRLGIITVDVGIPLLSMHSAREMSHRDDGYQLQQAATHYLRGNY